MSKARGRQKAARGSASPRNLATVPSVAATGAGVRSSLVNRVERWLRHSLDQMSDDEVLKAVEAQSPAETIAEILAADGKVAAGILMGMEVLDHVILADVKYFSFREHRRC